MLWYEDMPQSLRTLKIDNSGKEIGQLQPTNGHSNRASYKTKQKPESKMVSCKKMKKSTSTAYPINQSTIE